MLAETIGFVIGVDPHRDQHALAVIETVTGVVVHQETIVAGKRGHREALRIAQRYAPGLRVWAIEGTGSYGACLTRVLQQAAETVYEAGNPRRERGVGKTDQLDAIRAARNVLCQKRPVLPRASGQRDALRCLMAVREQAAQGRREAICQLKALVVTCPEPLQEQLRGLKTTTRLVAQITRMRPTSRTDPTVYCIVKALQSAARDYHHHDREAAELHKEIARITRQLAPQLLTEPGIGPIIAGQLLLSWSHPGRIHSEAAFARLAGAAPIPASSGKTIRYRLDRGGDRFLNRALHQIIVTRRRHHQTTIDYINRRTSEGKTTREAIRCLKRYLARSLYRLLETPTTTA